MIDPAVEVVMHAASEDLRICRFQTGKVPAAGLRRPDRRRVRRVRLPALARQPGLADARRVGLRRRDADRLAAAAAEPRAAPLRARRRPLPPAAGRPPRGAARGAGPGGVGRGGVRATSSTTSRTATRSRAGGSSPGLHQLSRRGLEVARRLSDWRYEEARRHEPAAPPGAPRRPARRDRQAAARRAARTSRPSATSTAPTS